MKTRFFFLVFVLCISLLKADEKKISVFLAGPGLVGSALIDQIEKNHDHFQKQYGLNIQIVGIASSTKICFNPLGIELTTWRTALNDSKNLLSWADCLDTLLSADVPNLIFVDCSSNQTIAESYAAILKTGIPIATPNKKANSCSLSYYKELQELSRDTPFLYDADVGAALPIINTIKGIVQSGDEIVKIEALLSGTLSYLFNSFEEGVLFSEIVLEAQKKGYTEPDPRDDLNGMDFARKLLILARESGFSLEMKEIALQRFLPDSCFEASSVDNFYQNLKSYDPSLTEMRQKAASLGKRLRIVGSFENGKASISLQAVGPEHPFYTLTGTDNMIAISTKYYCKNPLVIKGPGAGADLTAARVLENIVRISLAI